MDGFIMVKRSLFDHCLFKEERVFSRFEAWLDLIQMASFRDENKEIIAGKLMERDRGEVIASIRFLCKRWVWSNTKVTDYLEMLRADEMVTVVKEGGITKIFLLNFEKYNTPNEKRQKNDTKTRAAIDSNEEETTQKHTENDTETTLKRHLNDTETTNYKKDNKDKKDNKEKDIGEGKAFAENGDAVSPPPPPGKKSLEEKQKEMKDRRYEFGQSLVEHLPIYGKDMIRAFYDHWAEPNKGATKFKKEMEPTWDLASRLRKWEDNDARWHKGKKQSEITNAGPTVKEIEEHENNIKLGFYGPNKAQ